MSFMFSMASVCTRAEHAAQQSDTTVSSKGLQNIDEDDDILSAMARELVERDGIGESADAV